MVDARLTVLLAALIAAVIATAHVARMKPSSRGEWWWIWVTFVFLLWLLGGFLSVRG